MLRNICSIWKNLLIRYLLIWFVFGWIFVIAILPVAAQVSSAKTIELEQLIERGKYFYDRSKFKVAVHKWQQARDIFEHEGDKLHQAQALTYLSLAQQKLEQWSEANKNINHSLQLLKNLDIKTSDTKLIQAQAFNAKGAIALALGKSESALVAWQQATKIYEQIDDAIGVTGSLINQAQALENLGYYRRTCKTLLKASTNEYSCDFTSPNNWKKVLQSYEQLQDNQLKILGLRSLGDILRQLGDWEHSEQVLNQSLQLKQSTQARSATLLSLGQLNRAKYEQALSLYNKTYLSNIKQEAKQKALIFSAQALSNYHQAIKTVDDFPANELNTQAQLQKLSLSIDLRRWFKTQNLNLKDIDSRIDQTIKILTESQVFSRPPSHFVIQAQLNFAQSLIELESQQQLATQYIDRAQIQAQELSDSRSKSLAWGIYGHLYEKQQNWSEAEKYSQSALSISQTIDAMDLNAQWRSQLGRIYQAQDKTSQAIIAYESSVSDLDILHRDLVSISSNNPVGLSQDRETVYQNLVDLLLTSPQDTLVSQANLNQTLEIVDSLRVAEVEDFLNCNLTNTAKSGKPKLDPQAAFVFPIILENQLKIIVRLPKSQELKSYSILIPRPELEQTLVQWRTELERRFVSPQSLLLSQKVYSWLLEPIEESLTQAKVKTLVFMLDGGFRNLPMAALHDGQQYLIEKQYAVASIPSLQLLSSKPRTKNKLNVLAFGLSQIRMGFIPHQGFGALANVKNELTEIKSQVGSKDYLDRKFTSENLQQQINSQDFPILHLATHGQFSSEVEKTFLLAWDKRINVNNLSSILKLGGTNNAQGIELLVLSACQTAAGDNQATIGLAGIAIESGAKSTLASLWNVQDGSTAKLMSRFYRELANNNSKAEALRRSQIKLLHTPGYQAPFYWSPYVLLGNWL